MFQFDKRLQPPKSDRIIFKPARFPQAWSSASSSAVAPDEPAYLRHDVELPLRGKHDGRDFVLWRHRGAVGNVIPMYDDGPEGGHYVRWWQSRGDKYEDDGVWEVPSSYLAFNEGVPSGKKTRSWPAMQRAREGKIFEWPSENRRAVEVMERFVGLFDAATADPRALRSPCASVEQKPFDDEDPADEDHSVDGIDGSVIDLCGEIEWDDDALQAKSGGMPAGFGVHRKLDKGPGVTKLIALAEGGRVRINHHATVRQRVPGEASRERPDPRLEYRSNSGRWYPLRDRLRGSLGPDVDERTKEERDAAVIAWTRTVHSTGKPGAVRVRMEPFDRLLAKQQLRRLSDLMGGEMFNVLHMAACERATSREIGELTGKTYKRAEAEGHVLLRRAISTAQWAFDSLDRDLVPVNDNAAPEAQRLAA